MIAISLSVASAQANAQTISNSNQFVKASLTSKTAIDYDVIFLIIAFLGVIGLILFLVKVLLDPLKTTKKSTKKQDSQTPENMQYEHSRTIKQKNMQTNPFFNASIRTKNKNPCFVEHSKRKTLNPKKEIDKELGINNEFKDPIETHGKTSNYNNYENDDNNKDNKGNNGNNNQNTKADEYEESISKRLEQQSKLEHDFEQFLKDDEKEVVNILKLKDGSCDQGTIQMLTKYSKAKVSDLIKELESRKIVIKRKKGRKNTIILRSFS